MTVVCYIIVGVCGVMRKTTTLLTYRGDKLTTRYQVIKKIFWGQKMPVRLLYNHAWGTTISPLDEVSYIVSCLGETLKIVGSHLYKKISQEKNAL
jgi:hypothetical protein